MSTKGRSSVKCPSCGEHFDADFWTVVRGDRDAELKDIIINGEFDLLMCPHCGGMFSWQEPFIYFDPVMQLLIFIMPDSYLNEKEKWLEKMKEDYAAVKDSFRMEKYFTAEPEFFFGINALRELLLRDRDAEEETDVMEFLAGELKLGLAKINPAFARAHDLPFSVPYTAGRPMKENALEALGQIHARNDSLPRTGRLAEKIGGLPGPDIPFIAA